MANIATAYENLKALVEGFEPMLVDILHKNKADFPAYVRGQLNSGLDGNEKELKPTYLFDPWFKTDEAGKWKNDAAGYMRFKAKITPPVVSKFGLRSRNEKTPNLIITGVYHDSISVTETNEGLRVGSDDTLLAPGIENKYGDYLYKIGATAHNHFMRRKVRQEIKKYFSKFGL